jgi:DNA-binding NarL/FixJ family response regulator
MRAVHEGLAMWDNAEIVALLDKEGHVCAVSRNEEEAAIHNILGMQVIERVHPDSLSIAREAMQAALAGEEKEVLVAAYADEGFVFWSRVRFTRSPIPDKPLLLHARKLPRSWGQLSSREQELIQALQKSGMNPKRAARQLGITVNTLNAHRRSICQKCGLKGVGDFWVYVEHCR